MIKTKFIRPKYYSNPLNKKDDLKTKDGINFTITKEGLEKLKTLPSSVKEYYKKYPQGYGVVENIDDPLNLWLNVFPTYKIIDIKYQTVYDPTNEQVIDTALIIYEVN